MNFMEYQQKAMRTAKTRQDLFAYLQEGALGLCGEAGEVAEIIKKAAYHAHVLKWEPLKEELGDVMWYIALIAHTCGIDLDEVAQANIDKLWRRYPEGFDSNRSIHREGNGDAES